MADPSGIGPIRRISLLLDPDGQALAMLGAATALAAGLEAELEAVFLEDQNLLSSAELPFVHRINMFSATTEAFDTAGTEKELQLIARRLRRSLAMEAERLSISWTFRVIRGHAEHEVPAVAQSCDMVIYAGAGSAAYGFQRHTARLAAARCPGPVLLLTGQSSDMTGPVVAIYDSSASAGNILGLAARLSEAQQQELMVLASAARIEDAATLAEEAREWLNARQIKADLRRAVAGRMERLIEVVRESRGRDKGGMTVISAASPLLRGDKSLAALERLKGAVLLVRQ